MTKLRLEAFSSRNPAEEMSEKFECFGDVGDFEMRGCGWDTWDVDLMSGIRMLMSGRVTI